MRRLFILLLLIGLAIPAYGATRQKTWVDGELITYTDLNSDWDNFYSTGVETSNLADGAVTNAKLATITAASKVNLSALTTSGQVQGDVMYHNGTSWTRLAAGNSGQVLKSGGAAANPAWSSALAGWVYFDGDDGGAPSIKDHFNVSSITDNGVGDYDVVWNTDMATANYCVVASSLSPCTYVVALATTDVNIYTKSDATAAQDPNVICVMAIQE